MENLTVSILGREYRLACTAEEKDSLLKSAEFVDARMQSIRDGGKVMGADRIAVMAALQIAHELLGVQRSTVADPADAGELRRRVHDMLQVCDEALLPQEKLF